MIQQINSQPRVILQRPTFGDGVGGDGVRDGAGGADSAASV
jgi:hypothetical protein